MTDDNDNRFVDYDADVTDPGFDLEESKDHNVELDLSGNQWKVRKNDGREFGPTTLEELRHLASKGMLTEADEVMKPGRGWSAATSFNELKPFFSSGHIKRKKIRQRNRKRARRRSPFKALLMLIFGVGVVVLLLAYFNVGEDDSLFGKLRGVFHKQQSEPKNLEPYEALLKLMTEEQAQATSAADSKPLSFDMNDVERRLAVDRRDVYEDLRQRLTKILLGAPDNMFVAGFLGEVLAHVASYESNFELNRRAIVLATEVINAIPTHPYGYRAKIAAILTAGNFQAAHAEVEQALAMGDAIANDYRLHLYKGIALVGSPGKAASAVVVLKNVIKENPQAKAAISWLADGYLKLGDLYSAGQTARLRLAGEATHARSLAQIGFLADLGGDRKQAVDFYQRALKVRPSFILPRLLLSFLYYQKSGDVAAAGRNLQDVIERYSKVSSASDKKLASYHLCNLSYLQADYAEAEQYCDQALGVSGIFYPALIRRSQIRLRHGDIEGGVEDMEQAYQTSGDVLEVNVHLAEAYRSADRPHDAMRLLTEYLAKNPRSFLTLMYLVKVYVSENKLDEANRLLQKHLGDTWFDSKPEFFTNPFVFLDLDRTIWDQFVPFLDKVANQDGGSAPAQTALGLISLRHSQMIVAERYFTEAIQIDESFLPAHVASALLYLSTQDYKQAYNIIDRLPGAWKDTHFGKQVFFESLLGLGKINRAESLIEKVQLTQPRRDCQSVVNVVRVDLGRKKRSKHIDKLYFCAGENVYFKPAIELVLSGMFYSEGEAS